MSDISKLPTSIEDNVLHVFEDGDWKPVGRVLVDHRPNGTMVTIPAPDTTEGKETIALLESSGFYGNAGPNQFWLPIPGTDQSDQANDHANGKTE